MSNTVALTPDLLQSLCTIITESDRLIVTPLLQEGRRDLNSADITEKGIVGDEKDYVLKVDTANEDYLLSQFRVFLPGSFAVGEESFDNDRDGNIALLSSSDYAWILDPIDGTNNVAKYLKAETNTPPRYGIMAALLHKGQAVAGWIYTSDQNNDKQMVCAAEGVGAFSFDMATGALAPLGMPTPEDNAVPHVVTTISAWPKKFQPVVNDNVADGKLTIYAEPPKSAAHEMMYLLQGTVSAAAFRQFRMWDHLPGLVIVKAAGGGGALFNGASPTLADQRRNGILLTAKADDFAATRYALLNDVDYDQTEDPKPAAPAAKLPAPSQP